MLVVVRNTLALMNDNQSGSRSLSLSLGSRSTTDRGKRWSKPTAAQAPDPPW